LAGKFWATDSGFRDNLVEVVKGRKRRFKKGIIVIDIRSVRTTKRRFLGESFSVTLWRLSIEKLPVSLGGKGKISI